MFGVGDFVEVVDVECGKQVVQWGDQVYLDGIGCFGDCMLVNYYWEICKVNYVIFQDNWWDIVVEEVFEVFVEIDFDRLEEELIQMVVVIVVWIYDIWCCRWELV